MTYALESDLQAAVIGALEACGCWPIVNRVVRHRGGATGLGLGSPDLVVVVPTHGAICLELKRDKASKPSREQVAWHARAKVFGLPVYVVRSVTEALATVTAIRMESGR